MAENPPPQPFASARARAWSRKLSRLAKTLRASGCSAQSTTSAPWLQSLNGCSPATRRNLREYPMDVEDAAGLARHPSADRLGFARLTTMAFEGADLKPLRDELLSKLAAGE